MIKSSKLKSLISFCVLLLFSCKKEDNFIIHKYKDGSYLKSEYFVQNSSDTILNGRCSIFYKNNKLKLSGNLLKDKIYGKTKYYNLNGKIDSIKYIVDNKEVGEIEWYHNNGKIFKYNFYDDLNNLNFYAKYDLNGNVESYDGIVLMEVYQFKLRKENSVVKYKLGDKVKYQFMFPNIPNTDREFNFKLLNFDNNKVKRKVRKIEPVTLEVEEIAVKKGKNTIEAQIKYSFNEKNKIILSDTISFDYFVE